MKKAILLFSIFLFSFFLYSEEKEYFFYKNDGVFLNPIENPDKELLKIFKFVNSKNYKKARSKLYNLKLELKNNEEIKFLELFIDFLEKDENNGNELLSILNDENPVLMQIKAEIFWLRGEILKSFKIYGKLPDEILSKNIIREKLQKRSKNYCEKLNIKIDDTLKDGNFDDLCNEIESLPEKILKEKIFYKGKTICAILKRDSEKANIYYNLMEDDEKEKLEFFINIFNLDLSLQLKELKNREFDLNHKKLAKYIYNKTEDLWLLQNMPPCYLEAYQKEEINLKDLSLLFCLYFPQIKSEIRDEPEKSINNLNKFEYECIYSLYIGNFLSEDALGEKIYGDNFINYLKKFIEYLNLINPCQGSWNGYVECGIIPEEKEKDKISGEFASQVIRKLRGD